MKNNNKYLILLILLLVLISFYIVLSYENMIDIYKSKIALVFTGQPRFVNSKSYESIKKHLLKKYDCHVYAHFWKSQSKGYANADDISFNKDIIVDNVEIFKQLYKPIEILFEERLIEADVVKKAYDNTFNITTPYKTISYMTSNKKAFSLIKDINKYKYIIRLRTDLFIGDMPDLTTASKDNILMTLSDGHDETYKYYDNLLIFPPKYAGYYMNGIDILDELYDSGTIMNNEEILHSILKKYDLLQYCIDIPTKEFNTSIIRENNTILLARGRNSEKSITLPIDQVLQ